MRNTGPMCRCVGRGRRERPVELRQKKRENVGKPTDEGVGLLGGVLPRQEERCWVGGPWEMTLPIWADSSRSHRQQSSHGGGHPG